MGQGMGHAASVTDDVQPRIDALQMFVQRNLHIVELDFHTIKKGIVVGCSRSDLIQCIDHLHDTVQDPFRQYQA